jgi:type IV secretory pathway VirB10-like protein
MAEETEVFATGPESTSGGPWRWFQPRVLVPLGMAGVIALCVVWFLASAIFTGKPEKSSPVSALKPTAQETVPTAPDMAATFSDQTTSNARAAAEEERRRRLQEQGLDPAHPYPLAVPGNPTNKDPEVYKKWLDLETGRQNAPYNGAGNFAAINPAPAETGCSVNPASGPAPEDRRALAAKREQARLRASSVAVDFTKKTASPVAALTTPQAPPEGERGNQPTVTEPGTRSQETATDPQEPKTLKAHYCYELCKGELIEGELTNRITGSQDGYIDAVVTQPFYSHDWDPQGRRLLIPVGSRIIGTVRALSSGGDQQQKPRLFVAFDTLRRPDGSTFALDHFTGLDMAGQAGLTDLVNHHYLLMFGAAGAIAAIGAVAQVGNSQIGFGYDPGVTIRNGVSQQLGQQSIQAFNHFLSIPPTVTIREGRTFVKALLMDNYNIGEYHAPIRSASVPAPAPTKPQSKEQFYAAQ